MELSKRLQAVASLVTVGHRIADIGTDHAYIPIYLIQEQRVPYAIAMDINEGPLKRAADHVRENGLEEKIALRLSDGFRGLKPYEADTAVLAGMGGALMIKILSDCRDVTCSLKECILQPQSELEKVRTFLLQEGFLFIEEDMVLDEGKYYPMMKVIPPSKDSAFCRSDFSHKESSSEERVVDLRGEKDAVRHGSWDKTELLYGKLLLESRNPVLKQFLEREEKICTDILTGLEDRQGGRIDQRKAELREKLWHIERGLEYYAM